MFRKISLAVALAALLTAPAFGQTSFTAKDAAGSTQTFKSFNCSSTICALSVPADSTGAAFGVTGNPFFVTNNGTFVTQSTLAAETTKVIGTVNQGTSPWVSSATQVGTWTVQPGNTANTTPWLIDVNKINAVTPLMGNGVTGTGSQRVTIASDNTAFSVNATLSAETTKVIGTVRVASGGVASGSYASGAFASGAFASGSYASGALASGSIASGAMVDLGAQADAACGTATGTCSLIALQKYSNANGIGGITSWAGGTLGAMSAYGTSPGAVLVPGVNAFITGSALGLNPGSTTISGSTGSFVGCGATTGASGQANGTFAFLNCTTTGQLRVDQSTIGGTATDTSSGNKSAGTQRVTQATDSVAIPLWGHAATGAAPPAGATYLGANASGATGGLVAGLIQCDSTAIYDASTNGSTELKALTSGRTIYVCGYSIMSGGTVNVKLIYGTGTACATGSNNMTPAYQLTAQAGIADGAPFYRGMKTASANALCINTSAGVAVQAIVYYSVI